VNHQSKGRGLLLLCLLSDIGIDDAPTRILEGSHHAMPSLLRPFGDSGVAGQATPLPDRTGPVALATGAAGDVYLCHPFLVHAAGWPHRGSQPRFIAQPPISLDGPLRLDGPVHDLSPVARPVRRALDQ
jgi:Phytanoyl-CoA dioxygenase (PhyH)